MNKIWSIIEGIVIAIIAPPTPMEPTPLNPSKSTSTPQMVQTPTSTPNSSPEASSVQAEAITKPIWDTPQHNWHNVRVLCDFLGLTLDEKNLICACIYQESQFYNYLSSGSPLTHANVVNGEVTSIDYGIAQINSFFHISPTGSPFPSVSYVMDNPDKVIEWMILMYKNGCLKQWVSFSSGAYLKWLEPTSPMWGLAINS